MHCLEFQLENGEWMLEAESGAERFERLNDGSYICSDDSFEHIDDVAFEDGRRASSRPSARSGSGSKG
jgi:hypothetical protein